MRLFPQFDGFTATEMVKQPIDAFAEDLCFLTWAYIECYSYSMDPIWIQKAQDLTELSFELFGDEQGALVQSQISEIKLFGPPMTIYDGAIPSANSAMAYNLVRLYNFTGKTTWIDQVDKMGKRFTEEWSQFGSSSTVADDGFTAVLL